ncbi:hypothetical protein C8R44DRAFT_726087 [Mycena epipterygia]|nr:hypothetical protein C8R44DRAFT_726087 [Mycena epipterygia]
MSKNLFLDLVAAFGIWIGPPEYIMFSVATAIAMTPNDGLVLFFKVKNWVRVLVARPDVAGRSTLKRFHTRELMYAGQADKGPTSIAAEMTENEWMGDVGGMDQ